METIGTLLTAILTGMRTALAPHVDRDPARTPVLLLAWTCIGRAAARLQSLFARWKANTLPAPRPSRAGQPRQPRPKPYFPAGRPGSPARQTTTSAAAPASSSTSSPTPTCRHSSPPPELGLALTQPPQTLEPPPWGTAAFDYQKVVQPVLNTHCVRCHDGREPGRSDLRGTLDEGRVPVSYRTLIEGGWVHYFDFTYGMRHFKAEPLTFGTRQSRLFTMLDQPSHPEVPLAPDELRALKGWIDLNCPLWPDYRFRPDRPATIAGP